MEKRYHYFTVKEIDLRKYKQLERLSLGMKHPKVLIDGLTNIKELGMKFSKEMKEVYDIETIPESVDKIILSINCHYEDEFFFKDKIDPNDDVPNGKGFDYKKMSSNIKRIEIRVINKQSGLSGDDYKKYFPPKNIKLNELLVIETLAVPDCENIRYHLSGGLSDILGGYEKVKEKKLIRKHIAFYDECSLDDDFLDFFGDIPDGGSDYVETENEVIVNYGNIDKIPPNQKHLKIWNQFTEDEVTNPKVFEQIESILWSWRLAEKESCFFRLNKFVNCKKLILGSPEFGNFIYECGSIKLPPTVEDVVISDACWDPSGDCFDLRTLTKLKRVVLGNGVTTTLPNKHFEYVETTYDDYEQITNIDIISIDKYVVGNEIKLNWNQHLKKSFIKSTRSFDNYFIKDEENLEMCKSKQLFIQGKHCFPG